MPNGQASEPRTPPLSTLVRLTEDAFRGYQCVVNTELRAKPDRLVALVGLVAGVLLLLLDVWYLNLGSSGRAAFVAALGRPSAGHVALVGAAIAVLLAHGALGLRAALRAERGDAGPFGHPGHRTLQWTTAAVSAVFVAVHLLRHSPLAAALEGISSAALYERLRHELSRPFFVGLYVVGLGSLCLHAFQGFTACVERFGAGLRDQGRRLVVFLGLLFAIGLYVGFLDGLSHYVAGRAWIARPEAAEPEGPTPVAP